jgi:RNase P/RNase MRP subunit p29
LITDEQLDAYRIEGIKVRIVRDADPANDIRGLIVAWDDESIVVRRPNRKVVKLSRNYLVQPASEKRPDPI